MENLKKKASQLDYKLQYLESCFDKISHKKTESYVIQRIWHSLGDDDVKFVFQQYVKLPSGNKYALLDLFLPQLGIAVEVNEPFHLGTKENDEKRIDAVEKSGIDVYVIDCSQPLQNIHKQIDEVVTIIKDKVAQAKKQGRFEAWTGEKETEPGFYQKRGYLSVLLDDCFQNIDDICTVFETKAVHRGYLRAGGATIPGYPGWLLWFPNENGNTWKNEIAGDGLSIREYPADKTKLEQHLYNCIHLDETRVTFLKRADGLYHFVGIFKLDKGMTNSEVKAVWLRTATKICLNGLTISNDIR